MQLQAPASLDCLTVSSMTDSTVGGEFNLYVRAAPPPAADRGTLSAHAPQLPRPGGRCLHCKRVAAYS